MMNESNFTGFLDPIAKIWSHSSLSILPARLKQKKKLARSAATKKQKKSLKNLNKQLPIR
jgi:hypothetical protein